MTAFLFMRHGQPDFSGFERLNLTGWPVDIAPLSASGEQEVIKQIPQILEFDPELIVVSPVTRALHTAALLLSEMHTPFRVEFDLRDWLPDLRFQRLSMDELRSRTSEFNSLGGEWPVGENRSWEPASMVRSRVLAVLNRYLRYSRVLAVCHQEPIRSVTGSGDMGFAALVPFELVSP
jgi:broad specificity phosphatase PhoE